MRDEKAFNSHLSKCFKAMERPGEDFTFYMKAADKFRSGVSDFLLWRRGYSIALETKFVKKLGGDSSLLLKHVFSGPQRTFLESVALSGNEAFGLVAVDEARTMYLIPSEEIPESGNWKTHEFLAQSFERYPFDEVKKMLSDIHLMKISRRVYGRRRLTS